MFPPIPSFCILRASFPFLPIPSLSFTKPVQAGDESSNREPQRNLGTRFGVEPGSLVIPNQTDVSLVRKFMKHRRRIMLWLLHQLCEPGQALVENLGGTFQNLKRNTIRTQKILKIRPSIWNGNNLD